jgi:hypothetical protein
MNARFSARLLVSVAVLALPVMGGGCSLSLSLDPKQGQNAAVATGSATESSTATLVRLLESDDPQVRSVAVRGLAEMGESAQAAAPALHRMVDDPDLHVRYESAKALGAVHPNDPALPAVLMMIANDQRHPEPHRAEMRSMLQRVSPMMATTAMPGEVHESTEPVEGDAISMDAVEPAEIDAAPTTRPTELELTTAGDGPTTRPIMASERSEAINESASDPIVPRMETVAPAAKNEWSEIPGLAGIVDESGADAPPAPDINLFGYKSYTSAGAVQVRDWIQRQPSLGEQEKQARIKEFQDWRYGQDKLIYQKVLEK